MVIPFSVHSKHESNLGIMGIHKQSFTAEDQISSFSFLVVVNLSLVRYGDSFKFIARPKKTIILSHRPILISP